MSFNIRQIFQNITNGDQHNQSGWMFSEVLCPGLKTRAYISSSNLVIKLIPSGMSKRQCKLKDMMIPKAIVSN
uniref:Uncharacterized protein n=1 Tax=Populus trichocarpa TaxID=3694 RepID=A0A2K1XB81_POPTR